MLGSLIGIVAGWRRGGKLDSMLPPVFVVTSALPYFWVGLLLILVFSVWTNGLLPSDFNYDTDLLPEWSPGLHRQRAAARDPAGRDDPDHLDRRLDPDHAQQHDHHAGRGLRPDGTGQGPVEPADHDRATRRATPFLPNLSGFAMSLGFVISGAILVEYVFNYPGLGYLLYNAVQNTDYPLMQALFMLFTVAVLVALLICDFAIAWLDPRARAKG